MSSLGGGGGGVMSFCFCKVGFKLGAGMQKWGLTAWVGHEEVGFDSCEVGMQRWGLTGYGHAEEGFDSLELEEIWVDSKP